MPIIIKSSYTKKLGLPGCSSHSYSLTVETELSDISQLDRQSAQLTARKTPWMTSSCAGTSLRPERASLHPRPRVHQEALGQRKSIEVPFLETSGHLF